MTRHGKNCTAGAVYTYHEKKKDTTQSGYGSQSARMGKDSVKEFDCCNLTLQPCRNPVVTDEGYLYDKEAIIEYILHQKKENARKHKEYEKQRTKFDKEAAELRKAEKESEIQKFVASQTVSVGKLLDKRAPEATASQASTSTSTSGSSGSVPGSSTQTSVDDKRKVMPSFWLPSLTPQAKETHLKKPDDKIKCPMSNKPIKLKDLHPVHFTPIKDDDKRSLITKTARYVCAVTNDVLGNSVPIAVLKTSGTVVTMECVEKLIKKDMLDPINGQKLREKDIIQLQRGSSGFAGSGLTLHAKVEGANIN